MLQKYNSQNSKRHYVNFTVVKGQDTFLHNFSYLFVKFKVLIFLPSHEVIFPSLLTILSVSSDTESLHSITFQFIKTHVFLHLLPLSSTVIPLRYPIHFSFKMTLSSTS